MNLNAVRVFVRDLAAAERSPERQARGGVLATYRDPAGNEFQVAQAKY